MISEAERYEVADPLIGRMDLDCWAACCEFWAGCGLDALPDFRSDATVDEDHGPLPELVHAIAERWQRVEASDKEPLDFVEIDHGKGVGILIDDRGLWMLTSEKSLGVIRVRTVGVRWAGAVTGIYRRPGVSKSPTSRPSSGSLER